MIKKIILRGLFGLAIGVTTLQFTTFIMSLAYGDGTYYSVIPELIEDFGDELNATMIQTVLYALLGFILGATTLIWEKENWNLSKQTAIHFIIFVMTFLPIAYCLYWVERTAMGLMVYVIIFVIIYVFIWLCIYYLTKKKIEKINKRLQQ